MFRRRNSLRKRHRNKGEILPEDVLIDSHSQSNFNSDQFEGRIVMPVSRGAITTMASICLLIALVFLGRLFFLQVVHGEEYRDLSENNRLRHQPLFAERGTITDRNDTLLIWNEENPEDEFSRRVYSDYLGLSHILGYVKYPKKDAKGFFYSFDYEPKAGAEKYFNDVLSGKNGVKIVETDAQGDIRDGGAISYPENGNKVQLSIDAELQQKMYEVIKDLAEEKGFKGGAGLLMDLKTGELIVAANYPDYDAEALMNGDSEIINALNEDTKNPYLNRIASGLFTPGSIVKPFMALGGLEEGVITPSTEVLSTGKLIIPNPYNPDAPSIFTDWKAHGYVNVRKALAMSSNIFFYEVGGGFKSQKGIGIANIEKYMRLFGFGSAIERDYFGDEAGIIPNPEWKKENFDDDWRLGDTYFTSIGQYGFQITPLQALRAVSGIATGELIEPTLLHGDRLITKSIPGISQYNLDIVRGGMREAVLSGTAKGLNIESVHVAAKTGTAELGVSKANVNSWTMGYFPYEDPKYAIVVMMQSGDVHNLIGGVYVTRTFIDYLRIYKSEYLD